LLDRIKNLELEVNSYKSYVAESLPTNSDFVDNERSSEAGARKSGRKSNRKTMTFGNDDEDKKTSAAEKYSLKLKELVEDLTDKNKSLEVDERRALVKFEIEYNRKIRILEETNKVKLDLEGQLALIMIENVTLLKENKWRKDFNITNAKEIETYTRDIKLLQRRIQELENGNSNWRLKYENQELIKKNVQDNPQFRQTYIDIMSNSKNEEVYKGLICTRRLSQVVKVTTDRFTEKQRLQTNVPNRRGGTKISHIMEEENEDSHTDDDNLANELEGLDDQPDFGGLEHRDSDEDAPFDNDTPGEGIYRASEFDNDRFTVADKQRSSHINIGVTAKTFQKSNLPTIEEDEYYDPIKEKLVELKANERQNKSLVMKNLGVQEEQKEEEELKEQDAKSESEKSEGKLYF
jgi:hypothetical protein